MRSGDVVRTYSDISRLHDDFGYEPETDIEDGIKKFFEWFNFLIKIQL